MSVYPRKRQKGETEYVYDFVVQGRRFLSPAGFPTRRKAEAAEEARRQRVLEGKEDDDQRERLTLDEAAGLWWRDKGQYLGDAKILEGRIERLVALIGPRTRVVDIKFATVNEAITTRRKRLTRGKPPAPSTVNRDVIDTLRPIIKHAGKVHELRLPTIAWDDLRLAEPDKSASHREFTAAQMRAWAAPLEDVERFFLGLALTYGPRFGEMYFHLDAPSRDTHGAPQLELGRYKGRDGWKTKRKDGSLLPLPIDEDHFTAIVARAERARAAGLDTIWFKEVETREGEPPRLEEITYWAMHHRLRRAAAKAGIPSGRLIHGMRHHAGTAILRATRDIMMSKRLLGHRQVSTTERYAQIDTSDLRGGLANVPRPALAPPKPGPDDEPGDDGA